MLLGLKVQRVSRGWDLFSKRPHPDVSSSLKPFCKWSLHNVLPSRRPKFSWYPKTSAASIFGQGCHLPGRRQPESLDKLAVEAWRLKSPKVSCPLPWTQTTLHLCLLVCFAWWCRWLCCVHPYLGGCTQWHPTSKRGLKSPTIALSFDSDRQQAQNRTVGNLEPLCKHDLQHPGCLKGTDCYTL